MAVLKDNAYGHGARIIAALANEFGLRRAVVRSLDEALEIAEFFEQILILSHIPDGNEPSEAGNCALVYGINELDALNAIKAGSCVHLACDTLMHRNGLRFEELERAYEIARKRGVSVLGAYTHYRSADEYSGEFDVQKNNFARFKARVRELSVKFGTPAPVFHSHNSAATERAASEEGELVRVGMAQFGYAQFDESLDLHRVASLWADRVSHRVLTKGESVGYGGVFTASEEIAVATYDLGYGDGLLRYAGFGDLRLANGAKILGKMSMDSFSCEDVGEKVCVFDDANVWAKFFGTINYDILVKLSPRIKRTLID